MLLNLKMRFVSENINNNQSVDEVNNQYHEELLKNQEAENIVENTSNEDEISFSQEAIAYDQKPEDEFQMILKSLVLILMSQIYLILIMKFRIQRIY